MRALARLKSFALCESGVVTVDWVVLTAAMVGVWGAREEFFRTNLEGTRILLDWLKPGPDDELVDLGSGAGRFVLQVALDSSTRRVSGSFGCRSSP